MPVELKVITGVFKVAIKYSLLKPGRASSKHKEIHVISTYYFVAGMNFYFP